MSGTTMIGIWIVLMLVILVLNVLKPPSSDRSRSRRGRRDGGHLFVGGYGDSGDGRAGSGGDSGWSGGGWSGGDGGGWSGGDSGGGGSSDCGGGGSS